jgi:transposase
MSKIELHLSDDERQELTRRISSGSHSARLIRRAQILLRSADGWSDEAISAAFGVSRQTVHTVRKQAVSEGVAACLQRTSGRKAGQQAKALDGVAEAHLVALTCSEPPTGHERWTLRLLAERMVTLEYVTAVSHETVRQVLKKTNSNPGARKCGASRRSTTRRL